MIPNIKLSLFKLVPLALLALIRNVVAKMTGNANFTAPAVPLGTLTDLGDELEAAIEEATNGTREARIFRDSLVVKGRGLLRQQANYVRTASAGDAVKLASSGFEMAKLPEPIGVPAAPKNLVARMTGKHGELELKWPSVPGAHNYFVYMTDKDPQVFGSWESYGKTTRVRYLVTGLEPYKPYWFCVTAFAAAGESAQSDPAIGRAA